MEEENPLAEGTAGPPPPMERVVEGPSWPSAVIVLGVVAFATIALIIGRRWRWLAGAAVVALLLWLGVVPQLVNQLGNLVRTTIFGGRW